MKRYGHLLDGMVDAVVFFDGDEKAFAQKYGQQYASVSVLLTDDQVGFGWSYKDGLFSPPPGPTPEQIAAQQREAVLNENMELLKFARILLLELNAIRAGQPRPQAVTDFIEKVKDYL
jgi:hypothetical protein